MKKTTESDSPYAHLDTMSIHELLIGMNQEDRMVPEAVAKVIPALEKLVEHVAAKMKIGGRLFYMGAGTSGRLGIVDASECPPTFGIEQGRVIGLIAGGDGAIRKAVEFAEDDTTQGWKDLQGYAVTEKDVVVGIAASGSTPYVIAALESCNANNISTACIVCNAGSAIAAVSHFPVEVIVGPEFLTGSTRLKSGTAQKLVLNMLSTAVMIRLGHVKGNRMVDMQLSNNKLVDRGTRMIMENLKITYEEAGELLRKAGSVRKAIDQYKK
jgi:N-acetylmuramic acid 6-phosphate etherase